MFGSARHAVRIVRIFILASCAFMKLVLNFMDNYLAINYQNGPKTQAERDSYATLIRQINQLIDLL